MTTQQTTRSERLMRPAEVAVLFGVNPKTITRWARIGKLPSIRTRGGHRRFASEDIFRILGES
jgi:excisionase family DNA binding protein